MDFELDVVAWGDLGGHFSCGGSYCSFVQWGKNNVHKYSSTKGVDGISDCWLFPISVLPFFQNTVILRWVHGCPE